MELKRWTRAAAAGCFTVVLAGCASVRFVDMTETDGCGNPKDLGFLYYPPKPYLLVEPTKDGGLTASVLSLPDVAHPHRVQHKEGWGTLDFNFTTQNGMITTWGQKADSKGPETIEAISSGIAEVVPSIAGLSALDIGPNVVTDSTVEAILTDLRINVIKQLDKATHARIIANLETGMKELAKVASIDVGDSIEFAILVNDRQRALRAALAPLQRAYEDLGPYADAASKNVVSARKHLKHAVSRVAKLADRQPAVQLYEIVRSGGEVVFRRIPLTDPALLECPTQQ